MNEDQEDYWSVKAEAWSKSIQAERRIDTAPEVRRDCEIPHNSLKLAIKCNDEPSLPLTTMDEQLGFSAEEGAKARKWLIDKGYVALQKLARVGSGGQIYVLEPLAPLYAELKLRGFKPFEKLVTRSNSWLHGIAYPVLIQRGGREVGIHQTWFEREMDKVFFDVVQAKEGNLFAIEICIGAKNSDGLISYNLQKAEKCAHVDGIAHTLMAFHDSSDLRRFSAVLKKQSAFVQSRVKAISLGEFAPVEAKNRKVP